MSKRITFTGGGSSGHVTVNLALIPRFREKGWQIDYIGSETGIERQLTEHLAGTNYFPIATGKLRRYLDWKNVKDPFRVVKGVWQAFRILKRRKPDIVFSKGGFVSVPVVLGAWLNGIPVVIHESDLTPGLANRIAIPFAEKVCVTFPETVKALPKEKGVHIGAIIRETLFQGDAKKGRAWCGFDGLKPILLVMGGSLGSQRLNGMVKDSLAELLKDFQIVHICGKGQADDSVKLRGYKPLEYVKDELADVLAMTNVVVSRAGSNAIYEFLALRKPMLLIPLSRKSSRGDQIDNAESFRSKGYAEVMQEESVTSEAFIREVRALYANRMKYIDKMGVYKRRDAIDRLLDILSGTAR